MARRCQKHKGRGSAPDKGNMDVRTRAAPSQRSWAGPGHVSGAVSADRQQETGPACWTPEVTAIGFVLTATGGPQGCTGRSVV